MFNKPMIHRKNNECLQKRQFTKRGLLPILLSLYILPAAFVSQASGEEPPQSNKKVASTDIAGVMSYTTAPLRNRIRVMLTAPASELWSLAGDISRLPEYSIGLERVDVDTRANGTPKSYLCHFKPLEEGGESITHREIIRWYVPNRGYASTAEEPNALGMTNSLALLTLKPVDGGTIMTYDMYYDGADIDPTKVANNQALIDIGQQLIARFGGHIVEQYVEP